MEFHPYPQVITQFCSIGVFGPSREISPASACSWVAHTVSCLILATKFALFRLAFAMAPSVTNLTVPLRLTRWLILQKARRHTRKVLRLLVSTRFQVLFHSPRRGSFHLSLTVLVHYRSSDVFSLGGWTPQFPTGFHVSRRTQDTHQALFGFAYRAVTFYGYRFQGILLPN